MITATVTATSPGDGAGIGGGRYGGAGIVEVHGGTVTATSKGHGAGIGSGRSASAAGIEIVAGTVIATSEGDGAGIGVGFPGGDHGPVKISGKGADVTAHGKGSGPAIGGRFGTQGVHSLINNGELTIPDGDTIVVPADEEVINSGTITGGGSLIGLGTVENNGAIWHTVGVDQGLTVARNNFPLTFDANGGEGDVPDDLRVYAPTLAAAGLAVPDGTPTRDGYTFTGWYRSADGTGEPLAAETALTASARFYAGWKADGSAPTLTGDAAASFVVGEEATYTPKVAGDPAPTVTAEGLPEGLKIDSDTGVITGIPTAGTEGSHEVVLTASNDIEPDATLTVTIVIKAAAISTFTLEVTPGEAKVGDQLKITGSGLPEGTEVELQLASDPVDLGTATAGKDGTFEFTATVPEGTAPGDHEVIAVAMVDGETVTESVPVRILPADDPGPDNDADATADPDGETDDDGTVDDSGTTDDDGAADTDGADHDSTADDQGAADDDGASDHGSTADSSSENAAAAAADGDDDGLPNAGTSLPLGLLIGAGTLLLAGTTAITIGRIRRKTTPS